MGGLRLTFRLGSRKNSEGKEVRSDGLTSVDLTGPESARGGSTRPETDNALLHTSLEQKTYRSTASMASMKRIPAAFVIKGVPKALTAAAEAERGHLSHRSLRGAKITQDIQQVQLRPQAPVSNKDSSMYAGGSSQHTHDTNTCINSKKRRRDVATKSISLDNASNLASGMQERFSAALYESPPQKKTLEDLIKELRAGDGNELFALPAAATSVEIKTPFSMNFLTLSANVRAGKYIDWDSFIHDVELIFTNALTYTSVASNHNRLAARMLSKSKELIAQARTPAGAADAKRPQVTCPDHGIFQTRRKRSTKSTLAFRVTDTSWEEDGDEIAYSLTRQDVDANQSEGTIKKRKVLNFKRGTFNESRRPRHISVMLSARASSIPASTKLLHPTNFYFQAQLLPESYLERLNRWCRSSRDDTHLGTTRMKDEAAGYTPKFVTSCTLPKPPTSPNLQVPVLLKHESLLMHVGNASGAYVRSKVDPSEKNDISVPSFASIMMTTISQANTIIHAAVKAGTEAQVMAIKAASMLQKDNDGVHEIHINPLVAIQSNLRVTSRRLEDVVQAIHASLMQQLQRIKK